MKYIFILVIVKSYKLIEYFINNFITKKFKRLNINIMGGLIALISPFLFHIFIEPMRINVWVSFIILAQVYSGFSIVFSCFSYKYIFSFFLSYITNCKSYKLVLLKNIYTPAIEEIVWRGVFQNIFGRNIFIVFLIAFIFTIIHFYYKEEVYVNVLLEFLMFSIILGLIYYYTNNILICIIIHYIRNFNIDLYKIHINRLNNLFYY